MNAYKNPDIVPKKPNANTRFAPRNAPRASLRTKDVICVFIGMKLALFRRATGKIIKTGHSRQIPVWRNVANLSEEQLKFLNKITTPSSPREGLAGRSCSFGDLVFCMESSCHQETDGSSNQTVDRHCIHVGDHERLVRSREFGACDVHEVGDVTCGYHRGPQN